MAKSAAKQQPGPRVIATGMAGGSRRRAAPETGLRDAPPEPVPVAANAVARKLESIRVKGAMKHVEVANLLGTRPETVSRWNQGRAYPHASTELTLLELEFIVDQLSDFYSPSEARQWMFSPQKYLRGASPAELIRAGRIDEVRRLVNQLRDAVYL